MADEKNQQAAASTTANAGTVTLERVSTPPAQTWNRLRANDITLTVPSISRKGDVHFALPQLFSKIECGMGQKVTDWVCSQAADSRYVEVPRGAHREEPIVVSVSADEGQVADTGVMVREGASATIVVAASGQDQEGTCASLLRVIAEARSHVTIVEVLGVAEGQQHLESLGVSAADDARVEVRQYALGGGTLALGSAIDLAGDRARAVHALPEEREEPHGAERRTKARPRERNDTEHGAVGVPGKHHADDGLYDLHHLVVAIYIQHALIALALRHHAYDPYNA